MKTIYLAKITTLTLLSISTLFAQDTIEKQAETTFAEIVQEQNTETKITETKVAVTKEIITPTKSPEKTVETKEAIITEVIAQKKTPEKIIETNKIVADEVTTIVSTEKVKEVIKAERITPKEVTTEKKIVEAMSTQAPKVQENKIIVVMPPVPVPVPVTVKVPKLIVLDSEGNLVEEKNMQRYYPKKEVIFSTNVAPARFNVDRSHKKIEALVGDIKDGRVTAYLHTELISVDEVKGKLVGAGFNILSTFKIDKKGTVTSIVFTNDAIKKVASQTTRGFAAALRITVDAKNKIVVISNPIYLMRAFMQKKYDKELAEATLKSLRDAFPAVKNSTEMVKFRVLERFQFMENMPYYQDMKLVSEGTNKELLAKAKKSKKLVFEQHLENGSILIGVKLGKRTTKFVKKTGYQNAGLLPYPVLIENGKAFMLAPQYYIAVMYPMLKMSQFMKIATVPGAISKDIDRVFR